MKLDSLDSGHGGGGDIVSSIYHELHDSVLEFRKQPLENEVTKLHQHHVKERAVSKIAPLGYIL